MAKTHEQKAARKAAVTDLNRTQAALNANPDREETDRYLELNDAVNTALENPALPWYRRVGLL